MKTLHTFIVAAAASLSVCFAEANGPTAYEALQVLRSNRGDDALAQLVEVKGTRGDHQPDSWTLLLSDPSARGGVRELVVAEGTIASERTPLRGYAGVGDLPALDFSKLNMDSSGAFRVANTEARKKDVGFHWLEYTLRMDSSTSRPVWHVYLEDYMGAPVGSLEVYADDGTIAKSLTLDPSTQDAVVHSDAEEGKSTQGGAIGAIENTARKTSRSISRGTLRAIGDVQEWLTGERTVGPEDE